MSIVSGIGPTSGINYEQIISGLLTLERRPVINLQQRQSVYNTKVSAYSEFSTKLSTLKSAADSLKTTTNFYVKKASSSNTTVLDVTASNSATVGIYLIEPHSATSKIQIASTERRTGITTIASSTTVINSSGANKTFEYTYAGITRTLTVADQTTLTGLRDLINNDSGNPGVTASILQVGTNDYRLVLTGKDTGASNNITITANTSLDGTGGTSDFRNTAFTASTAADAMFRIGGVDITRSSNTITDVITGVTFTLKAETTNSVAISVTNDTDTIKQNIEAFVNAYNDAASYVASKSTYNKTTRTGGPFFDETTPKSIVSRLQNIVTGPVAGLPLDMRSLAQIGISTDYKTGTLSINSTTLNSKLSTDLGGVANIFTDSAAGVAKRVYDYTADVTNSIDGAITTRVKGLNSLTKDISDDIASLEGRLAKTERNLRRQFTALESIISGMTAQQSYLINLINSWKK
jgi:flagellar hook-associated protein 2